VIAIDGPAGSGKSTTASAVAQRLDLPHVESGALYRALTLAALDAGARFAGQRLVALARALPVRLDLTDAGFRPEVAGIDVSGPIRSERVNARVSQLSAIPEVPAVERHPRGAVLDGRDIGTVVFPDAALKIFLVARPAERALRRLRQDGRSVDDAAVAGEVRELERRDRLDSTRAVAPLSQAPDAVVIDTSDLSFQEQVDVIVERARNVFS
jgi:cytidylate kinase